MMKMVNEIAVNAEGLDTCSCFFVLFVQNNCTRTLIHLDTLPCIRFHHFKYHSRITLLYAQCMILVKSKILSVELLGCHCHIN